MNIIIYTVVILTIFYFLLRLITNISSRKISKGLRFLIILGLIALAVLFAIGGILDGLAGIFGGIGKIKNGKLGGVWDLIKGIGSIFVGVVAQV